jgi:hypothetical protein
MKAQRPTKPTIDRSLATNKWWRSSAGGKQEPGPLPSIIRAQYYASIEIARNMVTRYFEDRVLSRTPYILEKGLYSRQRDSLEFMKAVLYTDLFGDGKKQLHDLNGDII